MSRKKTNKVELKLETEGGEIAQVPNNKKKPFKIERGGIAKPLGNGFYYLQGKSHENGGIDMTFNTDARIFSSVPFLNGESPAERVMRGENPDTTFAWQERFKDVNGINDDGTRKAENGKEVKVVPTREEYITSKIDSVKANSLNNMLTRERGLQPILKIMYGNDIKTRRERSRKLVDIADNMQARALTYADNGNIDIAQKFREEAIHYYGRAEEELTNCENDTIFGPGCIYTSTDAYGKQYRVSGNETFKANPQTYGFIQVNTKKRQPGDLQQVVSSGNNVPRHMMMFDKYDENGKPIYVYNQGDGVMRHGRYPIDEGFRIDTYRFVGTPSDSVRWTNEYNKLYMNNSNKKQLGGSTGLIRVQANGKDRLMYVPFTGEETKANRKKAVYGIELNTPKLSYDFTKVDEIMESLKEGDKNKNWWKNNGNYVISGLGNIDAGITSYAINKRMLGDMTYADMPVPKRALPLVTKVNKEPELNVIRENLARNIENTTANVSSSRVANSIINDMVLNSTLAMNKIYADKENQERDLINQSRLNQQKVANANIDAYNTWRTGKTNFENTIREKQSENIVALADTANKTIQDNVSEKEKRRQFMNNLAVMAAAYPNVVPELIRSYGFDIELPRLTKFGGKVKYNKTK